jgi:hypothetical protein
VTGSPASLTEGAAVRRFNNLFSEEAAVERETNDVLDELGQLVVSDRGRSVGDAQSITSSLLARLTNGWDRAL